MRVQADDARAMPARMAAEGLDFIERNAELRLRAAGLDLVVVAASGAEIDAQEDLPAGEICAPFGDRVKCIEGHPHAGSEGRAIFLARSEVRRKQDAFGSQAGQGRAHRLDFVPRHALEGEAFGVEGTQDLRVRVGLQRVVPAIDHAERGQSARLLADLVEAVDVARCRACAEFEQGLALAPPPGRRSHGRGTVGEFAPARPEHRGVVDAHDLGTDQQGVQARNQRIDQALVDDEGQVEVVRGLRNQMHVKCAKLREHGRKPVQHRAHAAADQGDRRARRDHLDPAERLEVGAQAGQHVGVEQVVGRIERDGHVGLGRTDQVDRQAMPLEGLEHVGEEADLLPHADRFHRDQGDALARADRLDARRAGLGVPDDFGTGQVRPVGVLDADRHATLADRMDAARMQDLGAGGRDFLRLGIVEPGQQARIGHLARVGTEHAGHVGPDLDHLGLEQGPEIGGRSIRPTTTENGGGALAAARDEALGDEHIAACRQRRRGRRIVANLDRCRQPACPFALVGQGLGAEEVARVEPVRGQAEAVEVKRTERARAQLAEGEQFGLPRQVTGAAARIREQLLEPRQPGIDGIALGQAELAEQAVMAGDDRFAQAGATRLVRMTLANALEQVGDPRQRRHYDQHALAGLAMCRGDARDVVPARTRRHAGAAEFEDDPGGVIRQGEVGSVHGRAVRRVEGPSVPHSSMQRNKRQPDWP